MQVQKRLALPSLGVLLFAVAMLLGGVGSAAIAGDSDHERSDHFWSLSHVRAMSAESYGSLAELALASDAVVTGRIREVAPGREWRANEDEWLDPELADPVMARFATVIIEIEEIIGTPNVDLSSGAVELEIFLPQDGLLPDLRATAPRERAVFFLRSKADGPQFFRLVNDNQGLVRDFNGASHVVGATEGSFLAEIDGLPFEQLLLQLRSSFSDE